MADSKPAKVPAGILAHSASHCEPWRASSIGGRPAWKSFSMILAPARDPLQIVFAAEKVRPDYSTPAPDGIESEVTESFRLVTLDALVRMKLTSFRDEDRTHLRDLIGVGLLHNPER